MLLAQKHITITKAANAPLEKRCVLRLFVLFVVLLSVLNPLFATNQNAENDLITGGSHVVYTVTGENSITITNGQLSATPGHSIRLLPGTHISGNDQLTINIADKACQEAVAQEASEEREAKMVETVVRRKNENKSFTIVTGPTLFSTMPLLPSHNGEIGQQQFSSMAVPSSSQNNIEPQEQTLYLQTNIQNIHNLQVLVHGVYMPTNSWGDAAETVKVLRC
ncbi:MAG TPA: hypothetical protein VJY41_08845 [Prolixibacteraceae bacterium]|nr:hypothetical protein [Prolixibacteraceae bacterium]